MRLEAKKIVFLKDCWGADVNSMEKEGDIYAMLEFMGVPNIEAFGKVNDLRDHTTPRTYTQKREVGMAIASPLAGNTDAPHCRQKDNQTRSEEKTRDNGV